MDANTPNTTNPAGDSAPTGGVNTSESQAQGTAPLSAADVASMVAAAVKAERDSIFADLRRSGAIGGKTPKIQTGEAPTAPVPVNMRALDRALIRTGVAQTLKESAMARMEAAFAAENPTDADAWVTDYLDGFGASRPAAQAAAPIGAATAAPMNRTPSSDGGSPPPPRVSVETQDLLTMNKSDLDALIKTKGAKWVNDTFKEQMKGRQFKTR